MNETRITVHGNVVSEPVERQARNGSVFTTFRVATTPTAAPPTASSSTATRASTTSSRSTPSRPTSPRPCARASPSSSRAISIKQYLRQRRHTAHLAADRRRPHRPRHVLGRATFERVSRAAALGQDRTADPDVQASVRAMAEGEPDRCRPRPAHVDADGVVDDDYDPDVGPADGRATTRRRARDGGPRDGRLRGGRAAHGLTGWRSAGADTDSVPRSPTDSLLRMAEYIYTMTRARKAHNEKVILDDVSMSFYPGAKIGMVGPNGAGKSTILKIMAGLDQPSNGEARLAPGATRRHPAAGAAAQRGQDGPRQRRGGRRRDQGEARPLQRDLGRDGRPRRRLRRAARPRWASCRRTSTTPTRGTSTASSSRRWTPCAARRRTRP